MSTQKDILREIGGSTLQQILDMKYTLRTRTLRDGTKVDINGSMYITYMEQLHRELGEKIVKAMED